VWRTPKRSAIPLFRQAQIRFTQPIRDLTPEQTLTTGGFGVNVSGVLVPRWDLDDREKFAVNTGQHRPLCHRPRNSARELAARNAAQDDQPG
jgi:hypothetical protein